MRTIKIFSLLIFMSFSALAQDLAFPDRDISITILDRRERPVNRIFVQSLNTGKAGLTDRDGLFVFQNMADDDSIAVTLPRFGNTIIPVAGLDSIVVTVRSANLYSYFDEEGESIIVDRNRAEPVSVLNVEELLKQRHFNTLSELLQGRVAGLNVSPGTMPGQTSSLTTRGIGSIYSSNEILVVVDGIAVGTIDEADARVRVNDIKTVEVQKSGFEWGTRGANGVIIVTTR